MMITTRESLIPVPKSILDTMLNSRWKYKVSIDHEGNILFDFSLVIYLINYKKIIQLYFIHHLYQEPFNKILRKRGLNSSLSLEESVITVNVGDHTIINRWTH